MGISGRLRHTATVRRFTEGARNTYGIKAQTWPDLATVACWYQPKSRREVVQDGGGAVAESAVVFMLPTDIAEADRLYVHHLDEEFEVVDVHNPAGKDQHYEVMVKRRGTATDGTAGAV